MISYVKIALQFKIELALTATASISSSLAPFCLHAYICSYNIIMHLESILVQLKLQDPIHFNNFSIFAIWRGSPKRNEYNNIEQDNKD